MAHMAKEPVLIAGNKVPEFKKKETPTIYVSVETSINVVYDNSIIQATFSFR